jgi:hypothetical protein
MFYLRFEKAVYELCEGDRNINNQEAIQFIKRNLNLFILDRSSKLFFVALGSNS